MIGLIFLYENDYSSIRNQMATVAIPQWVRIIACLAVIAIVIIGAWVTWMSLRDFFKNLLSKRVITEAVLVSKVEIPYVTKKVFVSGGHRGDVDEGIAEKSYMYKFFFEVKGQDKYLEFEIPYALYFIAVEGEKGNLDYKGTVFNSFDGRTEGTVIIPDNHKNRFISVNKRF